MIKRGQVDPVGGNDEDTAVNGCHQSLGNDFPPVAAITKRPVMACLSRGFGTDQSGEVLPARATPSQV